MWTIEPTVKSAAPRRNPDDCLVERAVAGDLDALGELLGRVREDVYRKIRQIRRGASGVGTDANVYEEWVIRVTGSIKRFELRGAPFAQFRAWAVRIAVSLAVDSLRAVGRRTESELPEDMQLADTQAEDPATIAEMSDLIDCMKVAIEGLEPNELELLRLRYIEELTMREILQRLASNGTARTMNALYSHCRRVLLKLRDRLLVIEKPSEPGARALLSSGSRPKETRRSRSVDTNK